MGGNPPLGMADGLQVFPLRPDFVVLSSKDGEERAEEQSVT